MAWPSKIVYTKNVTKRKKNYSLSIYSYKLNIL